MTLSEFYPHKKLSPSEIAHLSDNIECVVLYIYVSHEFTLEYFLGALLNRIFHGPEEKIKTAYEGTFIKNEI